MHPRERVLGLAALIHKKGGAYPQRLMQEAQRLGVDLPDEGVTPIDTETQTINKTETKEQPYGFKQD